LKELGYDKALCYGDLGYWNLILTADGQVGVIDFGDIGYWDRSKDFIGLENEQILGEALVTYGDRPLLRDKIMVRQKALTLLDLPYYVGTRNAQGVAKTAEKIRMMIENS
jgi:aminoglycoside phosphotransferase (APT) family kinase protein